MPSRIRFEQFSVASLAVLALAMLAGCGDGLAHVTGSVTLDGKPLAGIQGLSATVSFQPVSGNGATGFGLVDAEGNYKVSTGAMPGLLPGDYFVTCAANQLIASTTGGAASGKALSDPKYASAQTSGMKFTATEGDNTYDVVLTSPPPARRR